MASYALSGLGLQASDKVDGRAGNQNRMGRTWAGLRVQMRIVKGGGGGDTHHIVFISCQIQ